MFESNTKVNAKFNRMVTDKSLICPAGYYASASFQVSDGRRILWAWVLEGRGYPYDGSVWAGVQA